MKLEVEVNGEKHEIDVDEIIGEELLKKFGLFVDASLIIVDGEPIPCKEKIKGRKVKIIYVGSRG